MQSTLEAVGAFLGRLFGSLITRVFSGGIEVPSSIAQKAFYLLLLTVAGCAAMAGLSTGLCCILTGFWLILHGVPATATWTASLLGISLTSAASGVVFILLGYALIIKTKFTVSVTPTPPAPPPSASAADPVQKAILYHLFNGIEIPANRVDENFWMRLLRWETAYWLVGLAIGITTMALGLFLTLNGFTSEGKWAADVLGFRVSDAPPGIVLALVGLGVMIQTWFRVTVSGNTADLPGTPPTTA